MKTFINIMLIIHIASGTIALISGLISMIAKKGLKAHKLSGKIFFYGMTGVFITAITIGYIKSNWFLFFVGFFSYYLASSGYRSLKLKKLHLDQKPKPIDWIISGSGLTFGISLLVFAVYLKIKGVDWGSFMVPFAFGAISSIFGYKDIRSFYKKPTEKIHWIASHGGKMGGAFIAAVTAFIVVNIQLPKFGWSLWLLPTVIIVPIIVRMIRKYTGPKKQTKGFSDFKIIV
jgi:hypothetical protein